MKGTRGKGMKKEIAPWMVPLAIAVCVVCIGFIAWRALNGNSAVSTTPNKPVQPGMYDFRKEAASGGLGRTQPDSPLPRH
jgi:hypothetical protein